MSLSSHLETRGSPVRGFVEWVGTVVSDARRGPPWGEACKQLLGFDRLPGDPVVPLPPESNPGFAGTAFDYRLRYHLNQCRCDDFVAKRHARIAARFAQDGAMQLSRFFDNL